MAPFRLRAAVALLALVMFSALPATAGVISSQSLSFATYGQPLNASASTTTLNFDLYSLTDQVQVGQITTVELDTVPLSTLQDAWEEAVSTCDGKSYGGISPTRSQCINGATITYPSGVKYCNVFGASIPCGTKYSSITINGAGPMPTEAITGTFEAGAAATVSTAINVGAQAVLINDPGTVDVVYAADVTTRVEESGNGDGVFSVTAEGGVDPTLTSIMSEFADASEIAVNFSSSASTTVQMKACVPPDPCQSQTEVYGLGPDGSADILTQELVRYREDTSATGIPGIIPDVELTILEQNTFEFGPQDLIDAGVAPEELEFNVTYPLPFVQTAPKGTLPSYPGVGLPIADIGIYAVDKDLTDSTLCSVLTPDCIDHAYLDADGVFHRTRNPDASARTGAKFFESPDYVLPTDEFRLDADLDFIVSGGIGGGVQASIPLLATVGVDAADIDLSTFWGHSQELSFDADLEVTYHFNTPTLVETSPGVFELVTSFTVPVGASFNIKDPSPTLEMTPVYSIASNSFHNLTQLYVDFALETQYLALSLSGAAFDLLGISGNVAALSSSLGFGGIDLKDVVNDTYALEGFDDVTGDAISFASLVGGGEGDLIDTGEFVAELLTGSPVSLEQTLTTPVDPFELAFDYLFGTTTGTLDIFLGSTLIDSLTAPGSLASDFAHYSTLISDLALLDMLLDLRFVFDGPTGSQLFLDNIAINSEAGDNLGLISNGDFEDGTLDGWSTAAATPQGVVRVQNGEVILTDVPEPGSVALLGMGLAALFWSRRRRAA